MPNDQPMSYKKILLLISMFMLLFTSFRIGWMVYHAPPEHPRAEKGFVDLSEWEFTDKQEIALNGEWEFYPDTFLQPTAEQQRSGQAFISVPGNWADTAAYENKKDPYGYGTYRLNVLLPDDDQLYGIRINGVNNSANVYINGALVTSAGQPSESGKTDGKPGPFYASFHPESERLELIIHVSNYENFLAGGIDKSVLFGTDEAIHKRTNHSKTLQIVVSIIFLLHFMYVFVIYFIGRGKYQKELFYYGLLLAFAAFAILIDDEIIINLPIGYVWSLKILLILFLSTLIFLIAFIKHLLQINSRFYTFLFALFFFLLCFALIIPFEFFTYVRVGVFLFYISAISFLFFHTIRTVRIGYPDSIFILIFITSYTSNIIWGAGIKFGEVEIPYYPFEFLIYIISIAILLFKRHIRLVVLNAEQTKQLQKADKMKDEFLANTSHEIRNPLHGIINIAQSLLDNEPLSKESRENITLLIDIGKRMGYTLNDLTVVTQLREKQVKLTQSRINLNVAASLVISMLDFMKEGKDITLQSHIPVNFPEIKADENRLIQILFNLVHNAIKFTEKGSIVIEADYSDEMATIYVKDSGIGIPPEQNMEQLFQAYERLDGKHQTAVTGIGIGLSVSKQLIELHGGKIAYESTNEGTTFLFTIPLATEKEEIMTIPEQTTSFEETAVAMTKEPNVTKDTYILQDKPFILIVDDDPVNVRVLQQVLINDYDVLTALSGKEALQKVDENRFDLIISDVMMPYMSGFELTKLIRKKYTISELPVLLVTARDLVENIQIAFEAGANDYLMKPVNTIELKTRVEALTSLKRSVKDLLRFEAAWLQAQIHPHFLFNTLNSIASLAEIDTHRMVALIEAFGSYLQKSFAITNVEAEIPVEDELELTRAYVHIEKERFGDRVCVHFNIDVGDNTQVPPLSIQPLVENAIMHGILEKAEGGTVTVNVHEVDAYMEVSITDDGVGMSKEKVQELLALHHSVNDGVGVKNTNRRLTQLYGRGLEISSEVGKGTIVRFRVPRM